MTAPRQILPGTTYLVTRRATQREFLLRPSRITTELVGYLLAVSAARFRIDLHAFVVMSNHYHLVLTDPLGLLPAFGQYLDSLVARAMNASYGRWESFWAPASYSAVSLASKEDVIAKAAYALTNPVIAGLVPRGRLWPGLWSAPQAVGADGQVFARPDWFFSASGTMPERAVLTLTPPPGFTAEEFRAWLEAEVSVAETKIADEFRAKGQRFMGATKVRSQRHTDRPGKGEPRRGLNPRVAARDKWKRIEALGRLKAFLAAYREALGKLRRGVADVVFPRGTYKLRVLLGVACAPAG